jgi:uncharacterized membrane protein YfcA
VPGWPGPVVTVLVLAGVVLALTAAVQGAVGFGMNLLAVPVLVVLDPTLVPGPALAVGLLLSALVAGRERAAVDRRLGWAVLGLAPGTAVALLVLARVPAESLAVPIGALVLLAVGISALRLHLSPTPATLAAAGAASGFLSTAGSVGGPPLALVYADADGGRMRSNLSGFFVVTAAVSLAALAATGHFGTAELRAALLLAPGVVVGYLVSGPLRPWVDRGRTRSAVLVLSAVAGVAAVAHGVWR